MADGSLPYPDRFEGNDDAGGNAYTFYGHSIDITATLDFWDDQIDVYRVRLGKGQTVSVVLHGPKGTSSALALWRPGTQRPPAAISGVRWRCGRGRPSPT